jgi:chemotaxis protein methyltransferase CheR
VSDAAIGADTLARVRELVLERYGLRLQEEPALESAVRDRARATGSSPDDYVRRLRAPDELRALTCLLTVGETYFYRNSGQLAAFAEVVVPERLRARAGERVLRVLSAGCSSGEEAYTAAILLREGIPDIEAWDVSIVGIDVNPALVERASRGRYGPWSLRQAPPVISRWLRPEGKAFAVDPAIQRMVRFEERNLLDDDPALWGPGAWDVVFFRNVAIYLATAAFRTVVARVARSLQPGGFLFLGDAETLRDVNDELELRQSNGAFYYSLPRPGGTGKGRPSGDPIGRAAAASRPAVAVGRADPGWIQAIHHASHRIAGLEAGAPATANAGSGDAPAVVPPSRDLGPALELLRAERFRDALAWLDAIGAASGAPGEPDVLLLRAAILTNQGELAEAGRACDSLLAHDPHHAGARYLVALRLDQEGDRAGALEQGGAAGELEPTFAMPHVHRGLLLRRAGDLVGARAAFARALELLPGEPEARVLLFGGGFDRDALVRLCRAELTTPTGREAGR